MGHPPALVREIIPTDEILLLIRIFAVIIFAFGSNCAWPASHAVGRAENFETALYFDRQLYDHQLQMSYCLPGGGSWGLSYRRAHVRLVDRHFAVVSRLLACRWKE
jgi:hypothetical protein